MDSAFYNLKIDQIDRELLSLLEEYSEPKFVESLKYLCKIETSYNPIDSILHNKYTDKVTRKEIKRSFEIDSKVLRLFFEYKCTREVWFELEEILHSNTEKKYQAAHQIVIDHTFGLDKELALEEIVTEISKKSSYTSFANDKNSLTEAYKNIENVYNSKSKDLSISVFKINEWSQGSVRNWSNKVRQKQFYPTQDEIVAVVMQAAKLHNGFPPRKTQILSIITLLNSENQKGRLAQINTGTVAN